MQFLLKLMQQNPQLKILSVMIFIILCLLALLLVTKSNRRDQLQVFNEASNVVSFESNELINISQILPIETATYSINIDRDRLLVRYFGSDEDYLLDRQIVTILLKDFNMTFFNPLITEVREPARPVEVLITQDIVNIPTQ